MSTPDRRITPYRPDLAAAHLRSTVEASRYVEGTVYQVIDTTAPVRREPRPDAALETEALMGEQVTVYDTDDEGWAWGQLAIDGYVGFLPLNALMSGAETPTHRVSALRSLGFPGPDIKTPPVAALPFGARVTVLREQDRSPRPAAASMSRHSTWRRRIASRAIRLRSPNAFSAHHICGAARPRSASTVRGWYRCRCKPAASSAHVTAICSKRRSVRRCL